MAEAVAIDEKSVMPSPQTKNTIETSVPLRNGDENEDCSTAAADHSTDLSTGVAVITEDDSSRQRTEEESPSEGEALPVCSSANDDENAVNCDPTDVSTLGKKAEESLQSVPTIVEPELASDGGVEPSERREAAVALAKRLIEFDGFKKLEVAAELSKKTPFGMMVAEEYLAHFDFAGDTLDAALRKFVRLFCLTGETYARERIIEHFSRRFYACNPALHDRIGSFEAVHTLACSLLLLNTDLHDQNMIGTRMTLHDFVKNLAEMCDGRDYPRDYLKVVYQGIKAQPLEWAMDDSAELLDVTPRRKVPRSPKKSIVSLASTGECGEQKITLAGTFVEVQLDKDATVFKQGILCKKKVMESVSRRTTIGRRAWHESHAILKGFLLYFHRNRRKYQDDDVSSAIPVTHVYATVALDYTKRHGVFRFTTSDWQEYLLDAGDAGEMHEWIQAVNLASARFSSPPLPAPIGSSRHFQRPVLPRHPCSASPEEQLERHRAKARLLEDELIEHRGSKPYGKNSRREMPQWTDKKVYLEYENRRYKGYVRALETDLGVESDVFLDNPSDYESVASSGASGSDKAGSVEGEPGAEDRPKVIKRSTSDRSSYKKAINKASSKRTAHAGRKN